METFYILEHGGNETYPSLRVVNATNKQHAQEFLRLEQIEGGVARLLTESEFKRLSQAKPIVLPTIKEPHYTNTLYCADVPREPNLEFYPAWTQEETEFGAFNPITFTHTYPFTLKVPNYIHLLLIEIYKLQSFWAEENIIPALRRPSPQTWECSLWQLREVNNTAEYTCISPLNSPANVYSQFRTWVTLKSL